MPKHLNNFTTRLNKTILELNGSPDRNEISVFCQNMPIGDSKFIRNFLKENESRLDLRKTVYAPSGEKVDVEETGRKRQAQFESKSYKSRFRTKF